LFSLQLLWLSLSSELLRRTKPPMGCIGPLSWARTSATWERIVEEQDENGFLQPRTNSYVELGTSIHRWDQLQQQ
jgi:hypothetical protein